MTASIAVAAPITPIPTPDNWLSAIADWFGTSNYAPHGFCLIWDQTLIALYWVGNGGIALAYVLIPLGLLYLARQTRVLAATPRWVLFEFAGFIICCGMSHVLQIINLYMGWYWVEAIWLNITSFFSLMTAVTLPFAIRYMMAHATREAVRRIIQVPPQA